MLNCSCREANESCSMWLTLTDFTEASENFTISSNGAVLHWKYYTKNKNLISQNKSRYGSTVWKNSTYRSMAKGQFFSKYFSQYLPIHFFFLLLEKLIVRSVLETVYNCTHTTQKIQLALLCTISFADFFTTHHSPYVLMQTECITKHRPRSFQHWFNH